VIATFPCFDWIRQAKSASKALEYHPACGWSSKTRTSYASHDSTQSIKNLQQIEAVVADLDDANQQVFSGRSSPAIILPYANNTAGRRVSVSRNDRIHDKESSVR
jgi:hypothetical protein